MPLHDPQPFLSFRRRGPRCLLFASVLAWGPGLAGASAPGSDVSPPIEGGAGDATASYVVSTGRASTRQPAATGRVAGEAVDRGRAAGLGEAQAPAHGDGTSGRPAALPGEVRSKPVALARLGGLDGGAAGTDRSAVAPLQVGLSTARDVPADRVFRIVGFAQGGLGDPGPRAVAAAAGAEGRPGFGAILLAFLSVLVGIVLRRR